jgi:hypothetical protein
MSDVDVRDYQWSFYWRKDPEAELPEGGIVCEPLQGHGYAVVRMPKYMSKEHWEVLAHHICELHNMKTIGRTVR